MKHQHQFIRIFTLLILFVSSICANALFAQSDSNKTMTITVIAVDEAGNQTTQTIVKEGNDIDEENIEAEIEALIAELSSENGQLEIDVNVEIDDDSPQGNERVGADETTITIDMSGADTQMMLIDTETDELDDATRKKLEDALEGMDIDLDDLLNGNINEEGETTQVRIMKKQLRADTPTNKAFLGVYGNVNSDAGLTIGVVKDSGAEKAGLKKGDQINSIDGAAITDFNSLVKVISNYQVGAVVDITYTRAGNTLNTEATLTGRKQPNRYTWKNKNGKVHHYKDRGHGKQKANCNPGCCSDGNIPVGCCSEKLADHKARLGVYLDEGDFGGAKVSEVIRGSDAEKIGIENGAVITKVGKTKIKSVDDLIDAIGTYKIGEEAKVHWVNGNSKSKEKVVFTKRARKSRKGCCSSDTQDKVTENKIIITKKKFETRTEVDAAVENNNTTSFLNLNTVELFPNPTDGIITIKFTIDNQEDTTIELLDVTGRAVYTDKNTDFDGSYAKEIDLTGNPEGVYILSITQNNKTFTEKIIFNKQ